MSPVAHSAIALLGWQKFASQRDVKSLMIFVLVANLPDIDFLLLRVLAISGENLHQFYTHNFMFTLLVPLCFFPFLKHARERIALVLVSGSHLLLDIIMVDPVAPIGFPLFFPFWKRPFNLGLFPNLLRDDVGAIFSLHNAGVIGLEVLIVVVPVLILCRKDISRIWKKQEAG